MNRVLHLACIAATGLPATVVAQAPDLEGPARSAAYRYESLLRRRAPSRLGGSGGPCDEIIGRFCFTFDDDETSDPPPDPEHPDIIAARRLAVRAYRSWLSGEPHEPRAAGGLIRYLIEDGRPREAVSVARTHVWASRSTRSLLLLGLALHYTGEFQAAEEAFDSARALAPERERRRLDDVGVLLEPGERSTYRRLEPQERAAYHQRLWALADPARRVPGNERRSAHYARHAWIRILAEAPRAAGMLSWGDDHEEIVLRFGLPRSRERIQGPIWRLRDNTPSIISHYEDARVVFALPSLMTEGIPPEPMPGEDPGPDARVPRSMYVPVRAPRTRSLEAQVTRLPAPEGWTLRIDAVLAPDTADPPPVAPVGLLVVLDTVGRELARAPGPVERLRDTSLVVRAEVPVAPGTYVYQVEIGDDSTGVAGIARYRFEVPPGDLALSDPLIAAPPTGALPRARDALVPSPTPVLAPEQTVLVYAHARGLGRVGGTARYAVEWWLESRDRGSILGQAFRWVGRQLGLTGESAPARVRWEAASDGGDPVPVVFALDLSGVKAGLYRLGLRVVDRVTGREVTSYRVVRLDPAARPLDAPDPG